MGDSPKQRVAHRIGFRTKEHVCEICEITNEQHKEDVGLQLDAHHLDGDSENNTEDNIILVCRACHRGIHRNKGEQFEEYHEQLPESKQWDKAKEWKTMRVPTDAWVMAKEAKSGSGMTWGEWLLQPTENDKVYGTGVNPEIVEQLQKMQSKGELMDQLTRLDNRLDELPEQTAGKVEDRLL